MSEGWLLANYTEHSQPQFIIPPTHSLYLSLYTTTFSICSNNPPPPPSPPTVSLMQGEVQRCQQSLEAQQSSLEEVNQQLEEHKSAEIEYKVQKCRIESPASGSVVFILVLISIIGCRSFDFKLKHFYI